jgi:folate-binding protein YgfZ
MTQPLAVILENRGLLSVEGPDTRAFLQGIVSNDVEKASEGRAIWSAFLTPQGKFLHDFFIVEHAGALWLTPEAERQDDLMKRLKLYKLRSQAEITDRRESHAVVALLGDAAREAVGLPAEAGAAEAVLGGVAFTDPRLAEMGAIAILPRDGATEGLEAAGFAFGEPGDYDRARIPFGLPDGGRDMEVEKATLLDNGFDELGGVDWKKGCYMGQELTARTKYRGLVKKRLLPVTFGGDAPAAGTQVTSEGKDAGEVRSSTIDIEGRPVGLALLRLDKLDGPLEAAGVGLTPMIPDWVKLPAKEQA